ncbi:hypothetical protein QQF64_002225 [Cirrhinus molitorella]|uniref:Uncharacterized protein n=1 Tax=Cirrhinus molitorella TaxID=172907 RepID=A0ABR3MPI4_9TELE
MLNGGWCSNGITLSSTGLRCRHDLATILKCHRSLARASFFMPVKVFKQFSGSGEPIIGVGLHLSYLCLLSFKPVSQGFAPFYYGHCVSGKPYVQHLSGFCWSKREGNNQRGWIIPVTKTAHIPTPPAFIILGRLRADLRSAQRLAAMIFGDLSPAQWTCQSSCWA